MPFNGNRSLHFYVSIEQQWYLAISVLRRTGLQRVSLYGVFVLYDRGGPASLSHYTTPVLIPTVKICGGARKYGSKFREGKALPGVTLSKE